MLIASLGSMGSGVGEHRLVVVLVADKLAMVEPAMHGATLDDGPLRLELAVRSRHDLIESLFVQAVAQGGLTYLRSERLSTDPQRQASPSVGELILHRVTDGVEQRLVHLAGSGVALVQTSRGSADIEVAAPTRETLERCCTELAVALGAVEESEDEVPVTFWALGAHGPRSARRRIAAPAWLEVSSNYEAAAADTISELLGAAQPPESGRLLLWHGEPGTGKTSAVRALARGWREWCTTHFITDPESFLGAGTSYLLDVLVSEPRAARGSAPPWKLIVLEDSGELLTADARERAGQALSRLLNVTDGLIGQGMKVLVLVTTNEPLRRLHPAVQRPGRCWKEVEFLPLPRDQANRWLNEQGSAARVAAPSAIADLYALRSGQKVDEPVAFGFGGAA